MRTTGFLPTTCSSSLLTIRWLKCQIIFQLMGPYKLKTYRMRGPKDTGQAAHTWFRGRESRAKPKSIVTLRDGAVWFRGPGGPRGKGVKHSSALIPPQFSFANWALKSFTFNLIALVGSGERKCCKSRLSKAT